MYNTFVLVANRRRCVWWRQAHCFWTGTHCYETGTRLTLCVTSICAIGRPAASHELDASVVPIGVPSDLPTSNDMGRVFFVRVSPGLRAGPLLDSPPSCLT